MVLISTKNSFLMRLLHKKHPFHAFCGQLARCNQPENRELNHFSSNDEFLLQDLEDVKDGRD